MDYVCDICGLTFSAKRSMNRHKTVKHTDWKKDDSWPICTNCHKHYKILKNGLCGHCNLNINGKDAICEQCHRHVKFYSNRQKICDNCMQHNIKQSEIEKAERSKQANLVCKVCGRQFTTYPGYRQHEITHYDSYTKRHFSESTKHKMSESGKGRKHSAETRMKMRYSKLIHSVGKKNADILFDKSKLESIINEVTARLGRKPSISDICESLNCYSNAVHNALSRNGFLGTKIDVTAQHSHEELEVLDFVRQFDNDAGSNRTLLGHRKEIDIYSSKYRLGIEFNGSFWHSIENKTPKMSHFNKTQRCSKLGIRLVHVLESEWSSDQDTIKDFIKAIILEDEDKQRQIEIDSGWAKFENGMLVIDRMKSYGSEWLKDGWQYVEVLQPKKIESDKWHIWNSGYTLMSKDNAISM